MRRPVATLFLALAALAPTAAISQSAPAPATPASPPATAWTPLFNGRNLDGWTAHWAKPPTDERPASTLFTVENGELHIYASAPAGSAVQEAYLQTDGDYRDYRLSLQYKWGDKKFPPRMNAVRDSGVIFHNYGPRVLSWPYGIETQIQEGDTGDLIGISARATSTILPETRRYIPARDGGIPVTVGRFGGSERILHGARNEFQGDWNTVEIIVRGDTATHIVNGFVNLRTTDLKQWDPATSTWLRLDHGKISLQAEFAEVFYRNIRIRPLTPDEMK